MLILGIVMLMIVGFLLFLGKAAVREQLKEETGMVHTTTTELDPIQEHVNLCLDTLGKEGLTLLGKQGGYLYDTRGKPLLASLSRNIDDFTLDYRESKVAYGIKPLGLALPPYQPSAPEYPFQTFPYNILPPQDANFTGVFGVKTLPPLVKVEGPFSIQQQLEQYIEDGMERCVDFTIFEEQGYEFDVVLGKADVIFGENDVSITFTYPTTVTNIVTQEQTKLAKFVSKQKVDFKDLYTFIHTIIQMEIRDIQFNLSYPGMVPQRYTLELVKDVEPNDDLAIVIDHDSVLLGKPYEFRFARKNRAPALYFMTPESLDIFDGMEITTDSILPVYLENVVAIDPDEDDVQYTFIITDQPSKPPLPQILTRGKMIVRVTATDGSLEDYQDITINNAGPPVYPDCKTQKSGCYDNTDTFVPYYTLIAGVDTLGKYLPRELCFENETCECAPGTFPIVVPHVDGDDSASACGCFIGADWSDFNGCCGDEATDCGWMGAGSCVAAPSVCGDGVLQAGEHCDGTVFGSADECTDLGFTSGILECSPFCTLDTDNCISTTCGNGIIDKGEECDGSNFGTFSNICKNFNSNFVAGLIECNNCKVSTKPCIEQPSCGNGVVDEPGEQCDGTDFGLANNACADYSPSFLAGTLSCDSACQIDTINCVERICGNGIVDPGESCDGTNFGSLDGTCNSLWPEFTGGDLICDSTCKIDTGNCLYSGTAVNCYGGSIIPGKSCAFDTTNIIFGGIDECSDYGNFISGALDCWGECTIKTTGCIPLADCGNGIVDQGEACDGTTFGKIDSCVDYPNFDGGTLKCTNSCQLDTSQCTKGLECGNQIIDPGELCEPTSQQISCPQAGLGVAGDLECINCDVDLSQCQAFPTCGNGFLDPGEQCDGTNFGSLTNQCEIYSNNFESGTVLCHDDCTIDTTNCKVKATCETTGVLGTSSALCNMATNLQSSEWFDTAIYAYEIVYVPCEDKEYLSNGTQWIPCEAGDVKILNYGPGNHDYLCTGIEGQESWVECCGNQLCQAQRDGRKLKGYCPSCADPGTDYSISDMYGVLHTCEESGLFT